MATRSAILTCCDGLAKFNDRKYGEEDGRKAAGATDGTAAASDGPAPADNFLYYPLLGDLLAPRLLRISEDRAVGSLFRRISDSERSGDEVLSRMLVDTRSGAGCDPQLDYAA